MKPRSYIISFLLIQKAEMAAFVGTDGCEGSLCKNMAHNERTKERDYACQAVGKRKETERRLMK